MEIVITPDAESAARLSAALIAARLRGKTDLVLGLATGRTMERVYACFIGMLRRGGLSCSACRTFNLDEYAGLSADDPHSYRSFMNRHLFDAIDIVPAWTHFPEDEAEGSRYEALIRQAGGIDLQLLGLGENGHIGFNEPLSSFASRTRRTVLSQATRQQNAAMFGGDASDVPTGAMTMGIATILDAREILLLATGRAKAAMVAEALEGPVSASVPATALHWHARCHVVLDQDAASGLRRRDEYDWTVGHSPHWIDLLAACAT